MIQLVNIEKSIVFLFIGTVNFNITLKYKSKSIKKMCKCLDSIYQNYGKYYETLSTL